MAVNIIDHINRISDPFRDQNCWKSHLDQQGNMGVADVMYTDLFDPCAVANVVEGDTDGGIDQRDQPVRFFHTIGFQDVYPDLVIFIVRLLFAVLGEVMTSSP